MGEEMSKSAPKKTSMSLYDGSIQGAESDEEQALLYSWKMCTQCISVGTRGATRAHA